MICRDAGVLLSISVEACQAVPLMLAIPVTPLMTMSFASRSPDQRDESKIDWKTRVPVFRLVELKLTAAAVPMRAWMSAMYCGQRIDQVLRVPGAEELAACVEGRVAHIVDGGRRVFYRLGPAVEVGLVGGFIVREVSVQPRSRPYRSPCAGRCFHRPRQSPAPCRPAATDPSRNTSWRRRPGYY